MAEVQIANDPAALAVSAAEWIASAVREVTDREGHCALALTGGKTPRPVYRRLAELPGIPWSRVTVYFSDERAVAPDHSASNFRMASETLLAHVPVPPAQVHRMEAERPDRDQAARDYEALLPPALDLLLLGMGSDGHVASLFPHAPTLEERTRRVVPALGGVPRLPRLTLTAPAIRGAARLLMLVTGPDKAACVTRALNGPDDIAALPAQLARSGTWILDRAAAAGLA